MPGSYEEGFLREKNDRRPRKGSDVLLGVVD
jgi:hypothetical protein